MQSGELSVAFEMPPDFGKDLKRGRSLQIGVWIDGAMPFRGETIRGYVQGLNLQYLRNLARRTRGDIPQITAADIEVRYRYNQDFKSIYAMVPAIIPILLVFIPTILMALGVVREKELGSITNLYATPVTRLEFLSGKQLPYIGVSMINFFVIWVFSGGIYSVATGTSLELHKAPIAIVVEDRSPLSERIINAFYGPYFKTPERIAVAAIDPGMDSGS